MSVMIVATGLTIKPFSKENLSLFETGCPVSSKEAFGQTDFTQPDQYHFRTYLH